MDSHGIKFDCMITKIVTDCRQSQMDGDDQREKEHGSTCIFCDCFQSSALTIPGLQMAAGNCRLKLVTILTQNCLGTVIL